MYGSIPEEQAVPIDIVIASVSEGIVGAAPRRDMTGSLRPPDLVWGPRDDNGGGVHHSCKIGLVR